MEYPDQGQFVSAEDRFKSSARASCRFFKSFIEVWLTQSSVADGTVRLPLYEQPLSISNADFRLYEFLKSSFITYKVINQMPHPLSGMQVFGLKPLIDTQPTTATPLLGVRSLMVEDDGIEPTTPCLQSRCSPS